MYRRTISPKPSVLTYSLTSSVVPTDYRPDLVEIGCPFIKPNGQKTPIAAIALTLFRPIRLKKSLETACKMTKRPVVELFGL